MRRLLPVFFVSVLGVSAVCATPAKEPESGGISGQSFGEGGGYKHPDAEVGRYMESDPTRRRPVSPEPAKEKEVHRDALNATPAKAGPAESPAALDDASDKARPD